VAARALPPDADAGSSPAGAGAAPSSACARADATAVPPRVCASPPPGEGCVPALRFKMWGLKVQPSGVLLRASSSRAACAAACAYSLSLAAVDDPAASSPPLAALARRGEDVDGAAAVTGRRGFVRGAKVHSSGTSVDISFLRACTDGMGSGQGVSGGRDRAKSAGARLGGCSSERKHYLHRALVPAATVSPPAVPSPPARPAGEERPQDPRSSGPRTPRSGK
jgi:hypothetical protein